MPLRQFTRQQVMNIWALVSLIFDSMWQIKTNYNHIRRKCKKMFQTGNGIF